MGSPRQLFVGVAIFFVVGVVVGWHVDVGVGWWLAAVVVGVAGLLARGWWWMAAWAVVALGGFVVACQPGAMAVEQGERVECEVEVVSYQRMVVKAYRNLASDATSDATNGEWRRCNERLYFWMNDDVELEQPPQVGERYVVRVAPRGERRRRYIYIYNNSVVRRLPAPAISLRGVAHRANEWAVERLRRLGMSEEVEAVCAAMTLGRREMLDRGLREEYIRSGSAHLLAVSGLHVGLLAAVVSVILRPLYLLRRGVVWSRVALVCFVAGYAVLVGLSPSVVRAALMAGVLGASVVATRRYNLLASVAVAAVVLLCVAPWMVAEVSFVLSFISMVAIAVWAVPAMRWIFLWTVGRGWSAWVRWCFNFVAGTVLLSACCTVATAPYVAYTFGRVALFGALAAPVLTLTAAVILVVSLLWVLCGVGFAAPLFGGVLEMAVWVQNGVVEWFAGGWRGGFATELNIWWMVTIYLVYALVSVVGHILASRTGDYGGQREVLRN